MLDGNIDILVNENGATITVRDDLSRETLVELELTPEEFCKALSRQVHIKCKLRTGHLERIGKKMISDTLVFSMPVNDNDHGIDYYSRKEIAAAIAMEKCPSGWIPDNYYGSKDSFFIDKDGNHFARTTIRRWE